ncbi:ABC-2 transporter permease [Clostridium sp. MB05]|jgi:ABC-2 type transport system permease protein|uniref:ABC-2 transporter permease n=1 Tax=Clostridium sp. MB05 TaxID=3376682 RepID=UPI003982CA14
MFKLIKKDLIVGLKVRSLKSAIITFIIVLFLLTTFSYVFPTLLPIMFTFIVVMNSFYYDRLNNSESFILSLPNKREDVVYSKYILTLIILFISIIIMYILFGINILNSARVMVFQDIFVGMITILFSFAIIIPIIFKYGYKIGRIISSFIIIFIGYLVFKSNTISNFISNGRETLLLKFSRKIGVCIYNIFSLKSYDFKTMSVNVYFIITCLIALIIFLVSMYISLKIYKKKDIA